ncbi:MAG TPA: GNAT family N-acetyltransferase [Solirubrobacteraceae bacterium]|nr:GNAT family N-acetyltransferase [Solirubrobacteraceae bacterium]
MSGLTVVALPENRLEDLKPLWRVLYQHHRALAPHLHEREVPFERAWAVRRRLDREWLRAEPQSFVLAAQDAGLLVGYAFVRVRSGEGFAAAWRASHPLAELVTLVVAPDARGRGIGSMLLDAVEARLQELGIEDMVIAVLTTNTDAARLYERRGAAPFVTQFVQRVQSTGDQRPRGKAAGELARAAERLRRQPLGEPLDWIPARAPAPTELCGAHVVARPVDPARDAAPLYTVSHAPRGDPAIWTYLPDGPYESPEHLRQMLAWAATSTDPLYFTLARRADEQPVGMASYLRIAPELGTIEIGHLVFGVPLQRTTAATEAIHLLARHAFEELGYRRLEWKCNALNAASRRAAQRFGFTFEGVFRKHQVVKGRNRDTAWYAITDDQWPAIDAGFRAWLAPANFDEQGRQVRPLGELIAETAAPGS